MEGVCWMTACHTLHTRDRVPGAVVPSFPYSLLNRSIAAPIKNANILSQISNGSLRHGARILRQAIILWRQRDSAPLSCVSIWDCDPCSSAMICWSLRSPSSYLRVAWAPHSLSSSDGGSKRRAIATTSALKPSYLTVQCINIVKMNSYERNPPQ
jgi:hypothetical protein